MQTLAPLLVALLVAARPAPAQPPAPATTPSSEPADAVEAGQPAGSPTTPPASRVVNPEFLEQFASTYRFQHGRPRNFTVTPSGDAVLFLRSATSRSFVQDLWRYDVAGKSESVLLTAEQILGGEKENLTAEELARRERMRLSSRGIVSYQLSEDGTSVLVPLSGRLFLVDLASAVAGKPGVRELKSDAGYPIDPRLSADGNLLACVRGGDLYVTDIASGVERRLTTGGGGAITQGLAEFVAQEEMDRFRGYWFSPDARRIAYQRTDTTGMETFHIADPVNPQAAPATWPYPRAGGTNAQVTLGVMPAAGGETVWVSWDRSAYPYLASVTWSENAPLTILVQNRAQTEQVLLAVDDATGATTPLLTEKDPAWLNLAGNNPRWLADGSGFLWQTEQASQSGRWALQHRARDGAVVRTIAGDAYHLAGLAHVDEAAKSAIVVGGDDPTQTHLFRVPLDGGKGEVMTDARAPGDYSGSFAKGTDVWVCAASRQDGSLGWEVRRGGEVVGHVASIAEKPPFTPAPVFERVGKKLVYDCVVLRPRDFDPSKSYPVIESVYGGPHATTVRRSAMNYLLQQWLADQGFIVVSIDGRGTPRRGRAWERVIKHDVMTAPLADHAAALTMLARAHPEMDLTRVGITGWSFGGYFSAHAAMRRPDLYKAAVAGAPVADWRDYDTHYTERYMGDPREKSEAYDKASVLTYCKDLRVPLLIIHGTADDNVYFLHSLKMTEALFRAGREFEFLPLAGFTHSVPDPEVTRRLQTRVAEFFLGRLGAPRPRPAR